MLKPEILALFYHATNVLSNITMLEFSKDFQILTLYVEDTQLYKLI